MDRHRHNIFPKYGLPIQLCQSSSRLQYRQGAAGGWPKTVPVPQRRSAQNSEVVSARRPRARRLPIETDACISYHLKEIYGSGELSREATLRKIQRVQREGDRDVARQIEFYNLDAIISVGYRVNNAQATQFRIWATQTLREFVIKGFVLDDERLKLSTEVAKRLAEEQYATFRVQQNRRFESDFEKEVKRIEEKERGDAQ